MDFTQFLLTLGAVVGIILIGLLAIVPSLMELPGRSDHPAHP